MQSLLVEFEATHLFHALPNMPTFPYESCKLALLFTLCSSVGLLRASRFANRFVTED